MRYQLALLAFVVGIILPFRVSADTANCGGNCKECEEVCVDGQCKASGMYTCNGSGCVANPYLDCGCILGCKPCVEFCERTRGRDRFHDSYQCKPSGRKVCPDGRCIGPNERCNEECNGGKGCAKCSEVCTATSNGASCKPTGKSLCADGQTCVKEAAECPQECKADCESCTEVCYNGEVCDRSFLKLCSDGSCIAVNDICKPKPKGGSSSSSKAPVRF